MKDIAQNASQIPERKKKKQFQVFICKQRISQEIYLLVSLIKIFLNLPNICQIGSLKFKSDISTFTKILKYLT